MYVLCTYVHFLHVHICRNVNPNRYIREHNFVVRVCMYICFNADVPKAVINVRIPVEHITNESIVVQWDALDDFFPVTYNVTWYNESGIIGMDTVNGTSYTVTGLTANTSYNITVVAINTCGAGPVNNVIMTMTNMRPPTLPPPTTTTTSVTTTLTPSPTSGNIMLLLCVIKYA